MPTMPTKIRRRAAITALLMLCAWQANAATASDQAVRVSVKHPFKLPPSATLHYTIKAKQHGFSLGGSGVLKWDVNEQQYTIISETRAALFGKIQESKSEGAIDGFGLAPLQFTEKKLRKDATITSFNRDSKLIRFTESSETYALIGGEQDRASVTWQLLAQARSTPKKFVDGAEWTFFVAGRRDAEPWLFRVIEHETITTKLGKIKTVHIVKEPPPDSQDQQLDIWLAPALEWYPLRLRFVDADGDFVEQTLERIEKRQAEN
jgi:hypothetical protein